MLFYCFVASWISSFLLSQYSPQANAYLRVRNTFKRRTRCKELLGGTGTDPTGATILCMVNAGEMCKEFRVQYSDYGVQECLRLLLAGSWAKPLYAGAGKIGIRKLWEGGGEEGGTGGGEEEGSAGGAASGDIAGCPAESEAQRDLG